MTVPGARQAIIVDAALSRWIHWRDVGLTVVAWLGYFYFLQDFFAFFGNVFEWARGGFSDTAYYRSFNIIPILVSYAVVVAMLGALFIGWALYNQIRFRGKTRRRPSLPLIPRESAKFYRLPEETVAQAQQAKSLIIHHDAGGQLIKIDIVK